MNRWNSKVWRWSWTVTLPLALLFLYWGWSTLQRYYVFGVRFDPGMFASGVSLRVIGGQEFGHILNAGRQATLDPLRGRGPVEGIRQIALFVPQAALGELNDHLPHSGFNYVRGGLFYDGRLHRVKLRYRGDFMYHWYGYKKSLRIKTRKKDLFEGMRKFNLIVPKDAAQLHNYLGYRLAEAIGLIGPRSELVELTLNGRNQGLHVLVEQLDESTLRRHGVMPGDLYAGELVAKDAYVGIDRRVFRHPGLWSKSSVNNHYPEESRKPLERLTRLINSEQIPQVQAQLAQLLDMDAWGRFMAYTTLAQSFHYDESHNWRLYFDPARSKFIPVVWDPSAWRWLGGTGGRVVPDILTSTLHELLYQNSDFLLARQRAIQRFFQSGKAGRFIRRMERDAAQVAPVVARDPNLIDSDPKRDIRAMNKLVGQVKRVFHELRGEFLGKQSGAVSYARLPGNGRIALQVSGRQPVQRLQLEFARRLGQDVSAKVRYWRNQQPVTVDISAALKASGTRLEVELPLISRHEMYREGERALMSRKIRLSPAYYELQVEGLKPDNALIDLAAVWMNGEQRKPVELDRLSPVSFGNVWPVVSARPVKPLQTWSGEVKVAGVREIREPLLIKPGTTVHLGEGAMLRFHDRLLVEGTVERPVRFLPGPGNRKPWGAVVLTGPGANGSRLQHCEFSGGSGVKGDLYEYSGMLSIHDVKAVQVKDCTFRDNQEVDDAVHAVYAQLHFLDSRFERAKSDALDLDISQAVIEDSSFQQSGNDAIDLMTTRAVVVDTVLIDSGDKGVSVGEGSRMLSIGNRLQGNGIGVQAKDGSAAVLINTNLQGNAVSLDAYKKNWRYGSGGQIFVYKSRIEGPGAGITADKHSRIRLSDSYLAEVPELTKKQRKRITLTRSVDAVAPKQAGTPGFKRFPEEEKLIDDLGKEYWNRIDFNRRGAPPGAS